MEKKKEKGDMKINGKKKEWTRMMIVLVMI